MDVTFLWTLNASFSRSMSLRMTKHLGRTPPKGRPPVLSSRDDVTRVRVDGSKCGFVTALERETVIVVSEQLGCLSLCSDGGKTREGLFLRSADERM